METIDIAAIYVGLNILVLVWLALRVASGRNKHSVNLGTAGIDDMELRVRTHGNATEYAPAFMIGLIVASFVGVGALALHILGAGFTIGRVLHAIGLPAKILVLRVIGMLLTWIGSIGIAGLIIYHALV